MECKMWEESGLLFTSGELGDQELKTFEQHLKECVSCTEEERLYRVEKERFYTPAILDEAPSPACDAEILRVCSDGRRKVADINTMPVFFKRVVVSFALFAIGFIGVGYVTLKSNTAGKNTAAATTISAPSVAAASQGSDASGTAAEAVDSSADSLAGKGVNFSKTRGNLDLNGVYPVDLQNK